ncbi:hypothetical protein [Bradyrhizobium sp. 2TAF24]|uniref:hypothetical protein n=1 Tax=Bradyrhizobium sp. 2TAF24 TaxID=3233011 RepID=UPI003F934AA0
MAPSRIMFIRHGEKPEKGGDAVGVTAKGREDKDSLIVRGWERAGALARFFCPRPGGPAPVPPYTLISQPTTVFACKAKDKDKDKDDNKDDTAAGDDKVKAGSRRPEETVKPLVKLLEASGKVTFDTDWTFDQTQQAVAAILKTTGVVLVSWEHHAIPVMVKLIDAALKVPDWPDRFDMVWVLDPTPTGAAWTLTQVPHCCSPATAPSRFRSSTDALQRRSGVYASGCVGHIRASVSSRLTSACHSVAAICTATTA